MKTVNFSVCGIVASRSAAGSLLKASGDATIVDRNGPRWLILKCPCGCGDEIPVNLDRRAGPAWRIYSGKFGYSLYPSVWRDTNCESHFIISKGKIYLFGRHLDDEGYYDETSLDDRLSARISELLKMGGEMSVVDLADEIPDAIPWDILKAARDLVRRGAAREGTGSKAGTFRSPG